MNDMNVRDILNQWYEMVYQEPNKYVICEINPEILRITGFRDIHINEDGSLNATYGENRYFNIKYEGHRTDFDNDESDEPFTFNIKYEKGE